VLVLLHSLRSRQAPPLPAVPASPLPASAAGMLAGISMPVTCACSRSLIGKGLAQSRAFHHCVGNLAGEQLDGANGIVVGWDRPVNIVRVAVRIHQGHDGDLQALGLCHRQVLLVGIHYEYCVGQLVNATDAAQRSVQLGIFSVSLSTSFLGRRSRSPEAFRFSRSSR